MDGEIAELFMRCRELYIDPGRGSPAIKIEMMRCDDGERGELDRGGAGVCGGGDEDNGLGQAV
jgi:hypothetical protein